MRASTGRLPKGTLDDWLCSKCKNRANSANTARSTLPATDRVPPKPVRPAAPSHPKNVEIKASKSDIIMIDSDGEPDSSLPLASQSSPVSRAAETIVLNNPDDDVVEVPHAPISHPKATHKIVPSLRTSSHPHTAPPPHGIYTAVPAAYDKSPRGEVSEISPEASTRTAGNRKSEPLNLPARNPSSTDTRLLDNGPRSEKEQIHSSPAGPHLIPSIPYLPQNNGKSKTVVTDIRQLVANLRAEGRLEAPPSERATSALLAYSSGRDAAVVSPIPTHGDGARERDSWTQPLDDDAVMADRSPEPDPVVHDPPHPHDIEDLYGGLPPENLDVVKKEEGAETVVLPPAAKDDEKENKAKKMLTRAVKMFEEGSEVVEWIDIVRRRAERRDKRTLDGPLHPRKPTCSRKLSTKAKNRRDFLLVRGSEL